jgi:gliding motility-associated-like protein
MLLAISAKGSHIIGGDIYYDDLGGGNYRFFITIYRDCNSSGAEYDNPLKLSVYKVNQDLYQNVNVPFPGSVLLPVNFDNPCATAPSNICVERAIYETVLNLPATPGGYTVSYQRCCRGPDIINILNPDDTGLTLTTHIPGVETGFANNSSPRFVNYPPILICNNEQLLFDHSATDPDGDELVYSLVTPFAGADSFDPAPATAPPPPYFPIQWLGGFGTQAPLGPGSITAVDSDGLLSVDPNISGLFVVGVRVQEYRNGVLIGETIRDFLFKVFDCNITMQAILPLQEDLSTFVSYCQGLTVQFENNSYGGSAYSWDFGVQEQSSDVSSSFAPTFTFPGPGNYLTTLIVNPGLECTDTAYIALTVGNPFSVGWSSQDSICIIDNAFDFDLLSSNQNASFEWTFDFDANIQQWNGTDVPVISFNSPGFHTVTLFGDDGDCETIFEDSIYIYAEPIVGIELPDELACLGLTVDFESITSEVNTIIWDFGSSDTDTDQSALFNPSFTYDVPGNYTVQLIGSSAPNCSDTSEIEIELNELLEMEINHNDSLCITEGLFNFEANVSGPIDAVFTWDFGENASVTNSNELTVSGIQYFNPGLQHIQLTGSFDQCIDSVQSTLYVYSEPFIDFAYIDGVQCAPSIAQFVNLSQVEGDVIYAWEFGDGNGSALMNPSNTYTEIGSYSVGLTLMALEGCTDTLYLMQQDLINVYPSPSAGFLVNPDKIDVCENEVSFINQSIGANSYAYFYDGGQFMTEDSDFTHAYTQSGSDYPLQVVYNEFGCSDSIREEVFVEPFTIYIPNTFIPDGDGLNDWFVPVTDYEIYEWDLSIYNRWGELVYLQNEPSIGWDGSFEGKACPDGVYIYTVTYKSCANPIESKLIKGFVNLIR